jgi:hypothetical protein
MKHNYPLRESDIKECSTVFVYNPTLKTYFKTTKNELLLNLKVHSGQVTNYDIKHSDIIGKCLFIGSRYE